MKWLLDQGCSDNFGRHSLSQVSIFLQIEHLSSQFSGLFFIWVSVLWNGFNLYLIICINSRPDGLIRIPKNSNQIQTTPRARAQGVQGNDNPYQAHS